MMAGHSTLRTRAASLGALLGAAAFAACASLPGAQPRAGEDPPIPGTPEARRTPALPSIPAVDGPLALEIGYPRDEATIAVRDSNFIFGSTGSGRTELEINGEPVEVAPNGGFLAFLPIPADGVYRLRARKDGETASLDHPVELPPEPETPEAGLRITSAFPAGTWAVTEGEAIEIGLRGPPGARVSVLLPDGRRVPLFEQDAVAEVRPGDEFRTDLADRSDQPRSVRYSGLVTLDTPLLASDTAVARPRVGRLEARGTVEPGLRGEAVIPADTGRPPPREAMLELVSEADTVRTPLALTAALLPLDRPRVAVVTPPENAAADWMIRGRNDIAGPFHYFWPPGTRLTVTGQRGGMLRVRLAGNRTAWVPAGDVRLLPEGVAPAGGPVAAVRFAPEAEWIDLRIPTPARLPFQVIEEENALHVDVFGAVSRVNFFQYGGLDPLITRAEWSQPADSVFRVSAHLDRPMWGYDTFFDDAGALIIRIRRPPRIDPGAPLRGLTVAVDPGHGGQDRATRGPTGFTEADANLQISLRLRDLLERAGARVVMTRTSDETVSLGDRPRMATESGAHLLVSIHNNAFPDGVNPWTNNGTSVYYYHPHSADLARVLQRELLQELGLRDIGYGRADLALVRPTWMPAALTETMFMMIPEHEAALMDPAVRDRIARAHLRALEAFVRRRAGR